MGVSRRSMVEELLDDSTLVPGLTGHPVKGTNSEGGGVERSKAGDNKDRRARVRG